MRTTLTLDDSVSKDVMKFTRAKNLASAVNKAVEYYVRRKKLERIVELKGKILFEEGFDPRALRNMDRG